MIGRFVHTGQKIHTSQVFWELLATSITEPSSLMRALRLTDEGSRRPAKHLKIVNLLDCMNKPQSVLMFCAHVDRVHVLMWTSCVSVCVHMCRASVCIYVTRGKSRIPTHTNYIDTFVQHPHICTHTTQYAHYTCTRVHLYAVCVLCHAEVENENLLFIAMAGTHQIWVHFLEDTKWRKGE